MMKKTKTLACVTALCAALAGCASSTPTGTPLAAADAAERLDPDGSLRAPGTFPREPVDVVKTRASLRYIDAAASRGHLVRAYRFADGAPLTTRYLTEVRQIQDASNEGSPIAATYEPVLVELDPQGQVVSFMLHGLTAHKEPQPGVLLFSSVFKGARATEAMTSLLPRLSPSDVLTGEAPLIPEE